MGGHRIEQRLADLERQLAELKKVVQITPGEVVIKAQAGLKIEGTAVKIEAAMLTLPGGSRPIVRIGDVAAGGPGAATITGPGNPQVLG